MPKIELNNIECSSCEGTGLYQGFCERDGAAVICHNCNGTGKTDFSFEYEVFTGKKRKDGVTRVYQGTYGYGISAEDVTLDNGKVLRFSQYGCAYEDWLNGAEPVHIKDLYCPYSANNRGMGNEPLERCKESARWGSNISDCKYWDDKLKCWEMFESEERK